MESIKILTSTLNEVLAYLGKRPYEEVFQHVQKIQSEAQEFINSAETAVEKVLGQTPEVYNVVPEQPTYASEPVAVDPTPAPVLESVPAPQEPIPVPSQPAVAP